MICRTSLSSTLVQNNQESRLKYWATLFACSALLALLTRSAALARSLAHFAHSLACRKVNDLMAIFSVFFPVLAHSVFGNTAQSKICKNPCDVRRRHQVAISIVNAHTRHFITSGRNGCYKRSRTVFFIDFSAYTRTLGCVFEAGFANGSLIRELPRQCQGFIIGFFYRSALFGIRLKFSRGTSANGHQLTDMDGWTSQSTKS